MCQKKPEVISQKPQVTLARATSSRAGPAPCLLSTTRRDAPWPSTLIPVFD